ncbi:MAG: hypothetical protein HND52_18100 [Ignavibacteriae bacterium]|nr:hypothetical protein [Ignavibacteriota bacterium]NOG99875.1 hypothetical protein [Ignavibacteriota bacterium]
MPGKKKDTVGEPTLPLYATNESILDDTKPSNVKKNEIEDIVSEAFSKSRFLANSIGFYSFIIKSKSSDKKILPFIYLALITASELRIHNNKIEEFYNSYYKKVNNYFEGDVESYKNWGIAFFLYLISENPQKYGVTKNPMYEFLYIQKAVEFIREVRNGKKSAKAMLEFIKYFPEEQNTVAELKNFILMVKEDDPFLNLPQINHEISKIIDKEDFKEQRLKYWVKIIKILGNVLENSTKDPKDVVLHFLSNTTERKSELDILLFTLFLTRLFYGSPYEKTIPLSFIDNPSMNFIAPLSEAFINPKSIIDSSKKAKSNLDEYFWTYVRNNPKSIFEDIKVEEIEIIKKVKRKNFGGIILFDYE